MANKKSNNEDTQKRNLYAFFTQDYLKHLYADEFNRDKASIAGELKRKHAIKNKYGEFKRDVNRSRFLIDGKPFRQSVDGEMQTVSLHYGGEVEVYTNKSQAERNDFSFDRFKEQISSLATKGGLSKRESSEITDHISAHASQHRFGQIGESVIKMALANDSSIIVQDAERLGSFSVENGRIKYTESVSIQSYALMADDGNMTHFSSPEDEDIATVTLESYISYRDGQIFHEIGDIIIHKQSSLADNIFTEDFLASESLGGAVQTKEWGTNKIFAAIVANDPELLSQYKQDNAMDERADPNPIQHSLHLSNSFYEKYEKAYDVAKCKMIALAGGEPSLLKSGAESIERFIQIRSALETTNKLLKTGHNKEGTPFTKPEIAILTEQKINLTRKFDAVAEKLSVIAFEKVKSSLKNNMVQYKKNSFFISKQRKTSMKTLNDKISKISDSDDINSSIKLAMLVNIIEAEKAKVDKHQNSSNRRWKKSSFSFMHKTSSRLSQVYQNVLKDTKPILDELQIPSIDVKQTLDADLPPPPSITPH